MPNPRSAAAKLPRGIQSATVGLQVLKALAEKTGPQHLREIAAAAGMGTSNVYRYLVSFCAAGLVVQGQDGRYDLGPFAIQLGLAALARVDGLGLAVEGLARLVEAVDFDGHVCVFGSGGVTVVRWLGRPREILIRATEGTILSPSATATGRLWGAFLPGKAFEPILHADLARRAAAERTSIAVLKDQYQSRVEQVRKSGLSLSQGERRVGIDALCGPIFDRDGALAYSLTLMGMPQSFDPALKDAPARRMRETLTEISRSLGAVPKALIRYPWLSAPEAEASRPRAKRS